MIKEFYCLTCQDDRKYHKTKSTWFCNKCGIEAAGPDWWIDPPKWMSIKKQKKRIKQLRKEI